MMAKQFNTISSDSLMAFAQSFSVTKGQPLDDREIYTSKEDLEKAATGPTTYVGQTLKLINGDGSVDSYIIKNTAGDLEKLQLESKFQEEFEDFLDNSYITLQEDTTNANYSILKFTKRGAQ
jgi:hypothetical protein